MNSSEQSDGNSSDMEIEGVTTATAQSKGNDGLKGADAPSQAADKDEKMAATPDFLEAFNKVVISEKKPASNKTKKSTLQMQVDQGLPTQTAQGKSNDSAKFRSLSASPMQISTTIAKEGMQTEYAFAQTTDKDEKMPAASLSTLGSGKAQKSIVHKKNQNTKRKRPKRRGAMKF